MITKNSCRKILRATGMRVENIVSIRLQIYLNEVAHKIANDLKELAGHSDRRTIQDSDFVFLMNKGGKDGN